MHYQCPACLHFLIQDSNPEGLNYCPACHRLFFVPPRTMVASWVWGVLVVLVANLQILL